VSDHNVRNTNTLIWTIGSGGLIGSAINLQSPNPFRAEKICWNDSTQAFADLLNNLKSFTNEIRNRHYASWAIVWAAGSATTTSDQLKAESELKLFVAFLNALGNTFRETAITFPGTFLLISSAGGIYAGSKNPPFNEATKPHPIGVYGELKLAQEIATEEQLKSTSIEIKIARVSNAYGPGQDLTKLQGLISRLALSTLTRDPINLFVPLSTVRDFIFTSDLADQIHALLQRQETNNFDQNNRIRIVASGSGTSIGQVLRTCQGVFHRKIPTAMGSHPSARAQAADLRFASIYPADTGQLTPTPLPVGIKIVFDDVSRRLSMNGVGHYLDVQRT